MMKIFWIGAPVCSTEHVNLLNALSRTDRHSSILDQGKEAQGRDSEQQRQPADDYAVHDQRRQGLLHLRVYGPVDRPGTA